MRIIRLSGAFLALAAAWLCLGPAAEASPPEGAPVFLKWSFERPAPLPGGGMELALSLSASSGEPLSGALWCYKLISMKSFREMGPPPPPLVYCGAFEDGSGILKISSGQTVLADAQASAVSGGRRMFAQTSTMIFGDSFGSDELPPSNADFPPWPDHGLFSTGFMYWPQTGETFTLVPRGPGPPLEYRVYEDGGPSPGSYARDALGMGFTPDHDPRLNAESASASKAIYFVGTAPDGSVYSYTVYIHRSRYANHSLPAGFAVFSASLGVTGLVILSRRARRGRSLRCALKPS